MASQVVPYDQLTEVCFTDSSARHAGITRKWTGAAVRPVSGTSLKDRGEGKSSHWKELQAVHLVAHLSWKETWPDVWLHTDSWAEANGLAEWARAWKVYD